MSRKCHGNLGIENRNLDQLGKKENFMFSAKTKNAAKSPGLVVMGDDSFSRGRGFESRHCILDGYFFTFICCKNCAGCLKRPEINKKEAGVRPFFNCS